MSSGNSESSPTVAVLATMNTKSKEALFIAELLTTDGARPWIMDLSLRPHNIPGADLSGGLVASAGGSSWTDLNAQTRQQATSVMVQGGSRILAEKVKRREVAGAIGLGGANGTYLVSSILRPLPYLLPKVVVSTVAGTAAMQWCVGESDICMFPSIGDISLNRLTKVVMENAALTAATGARKWTARLIGAVSSTPLIGVSSFGGTAACVDHVTQRLEANGYEVIQFHASGVGGKCLQRLASTSELAGIIDVTTHELADFVAGGVYSAGEQRLTGAGVAGLPQVVVPGAIDHVNFWADQALPECYRNREFFRYNAQNLLMRTNAEEFGKIGALMAQQLNAARGPVRVLIPFEGFSEHTKRRAQDLTGQDCGPWRRPEEYRIFTRVLESNLDSHIHVEELPEHINALRFAAASVDTLEEITKRLASR